jgi:hypothetical protein
VVRSRSAGAAVANTTITLEGIAYGDIDGVVADFIVNLEIATKKNFENNLKLKVRLGKHTR